MNNLTHINKKVKQSINELKSLIFSAKIAIIFCRERVEYLLRNRKYDPPKNQREILRELGTNFTKHLNKRSLYSHLLGTYRILKKWGISEEICLAGLYHSIYGTYNYRKCVVNLEQRDIIRAAIGSEAEKLVYYYCLEDRKYFPTNFNQVNKFKLRNWLEEKEISLIQNEFIALITIRLADYLEQLPYTHDYRYQEFYPNLKPFLNQKAFDDFLIAYKKK